MKNKNKYLGETIRYIREAKEELDKDKITNIDELEIMEQLALAEWVNKREQEEGEGNAER